jgi:hypothetical protein
MNNGLDKLPGHAYAPGLEPNWIDLLVNWERTSSVGVVLPSLLLAGVALVVAMRMLAARPRMSQRGVRARQYNRPPESAVREASVAKIMARTIADPNFADDPAPRHSGTRLGESEA